MRYRTLHIAIASLLAVLAPGQAKAQGSPVDFGVFAGPTLPAGDAGDQLETGYNIGISLGFTPPLLPLGIRLDGAWHQLGFASGTGAEGDDLRLVAGTANAVLRLPYPLLGPYLIGGIGAYNVRDPRATGDENAFGWNIGAGIRVSLAGFQAFAEARYHRFTADDVDTSLVPLSVGLVF